MPEAAQKQPCLPPVVFMPEYVDFEGVPKCLMDKRLGLVAVDSATFSGEKLLEKKRYYPFLVLEKGHFVLFSQDHSPIKFDYKARNAVMSLLWRSHPISDLSATKFVEVDGLWQLEQLPVLCFVFGRDADAVVSSYLIDDNTVCEFFESETAMDMSELAAVAQGKSGVCVPHFFVANRGKEYWAVDTSDPSIRYAFGPSTKTRTISRLAGGSMTVRGLIDEEQSLASTEAHVSQDSGFKLCDRNGEEVVEGEEFVLQIGSERGENPDELGSTMFEDMDWLDAFDLSNDRSKPEVLPCGSVDRGGQFGVSVVDGITYITFEGQILQLSDDDNSMDVVVRPDVPSKSNRIRINYTDDGDINLSNWETTAFITCDWIKASYGAICLGDEGEKLRLTKL
ncbi:hypothetical protein H4S02_003533 [Coemansia sp. RSA 2611]|nr:hypothetical protein H4S02_003533 [Coemansia sp. RSA 2611]